MFYLFRKKSKLTEANVEFLSDDDRVINFDDNEAKETIVVVK
jgi:hypothetical protein